MSSSSAATAAPELLEEGRAAGSAGLPTAIPGLMWKPVPLGLSQLQGVLKLAHRSCVRACHPYVPTQQRSTR